MAARETLTTFKAGDINPKLVLGTDGTDTFPLKVDSNGTVAVQGVASGTAVVVAGPAADDAAASGNPVPVGGIYNSTKPTYTNLDRTQLQTTTRGAVWAAIATSDGTTVATVSGRGNDSIASNSANLLDVNASGWVYNGTTWDRVRNNQDVTVFSSAARTATPTPFDGVNYDGKSLHLVIDCTADPAAASVTFTIQGQDVVSGKFYTILASAAITGVGTTILRVGPGLTTAANLVANDVLPRSWRVIATHVDSDSITYSVGASIVNG